MACEDLAREALEPFARAAGYFDDDERARVGLAPAPDNLVGGYGGVNVGDLRRARTAYDAIGSGAKALEWEKPSWGAHERAYTGVGVYRLKARDMKFFFKFEDIESPSFDTPDEAKAAAQADFERRVLSCLSTHTAAGAGPVAGDFVLVPREPTEAMLKAAVETCGMPWLDAIPPHEDADDFILRQAFRAMLAAAPSTSSPQNGDAGAGPAEPRRMAEGCCSAVNPCGHQQRDPYSICDVCTRAAGAGPVGEAVAEAEAERLHEAWGDFETDYDLVREGHPHIHYRQCREAFESAWPDAKKATANAAAILAACPAVEPVEVAHASAERSAAEVFAPLPGLVERLARERDEAREGWAREEAYHLSAEAALAETRERLEKVEAERRDRDSEIVILLANLRHMEEIAGETLEAEDAQMVSDIEAGLSARRDALSTQESSAALAGDGKEAGL